MTESVDIHADGVEVKKSCCYFCHQNCGVLAYVKDGKLIYAEGDPDHPTNAGGLCTRGNQAMTFVDNPSRVNYPLKRAGEKGENKWERVSWEQALDEISTKLNTIKEESGAEAVAAAAGTLRTDDWARRRFLNMFGTPNGFHNALLCWIPTFMVETSVSGWSPFETDLGASKCVIMWGFNPGAASMPGAHGYFDLQRDNGLKLIVIDPRYTETAAHADLWLPIRPGGDTALSLAMLNVIVTEFLYDMKFVKEWCTDIKPLREHIKQYTPEWAAPLTWLEPDQIREAARMYANNTPGNIQWACTWDQLGRSAGAGMHARALMRAICGNLDVPGGDGMPGPAAYITDEEMEANDRLSEEAKKKQIGADKYPMTTWPGYGRLAEISKRKWGKAFTAEWMCEAHGPSVFKAILTGDPYQVRALIVSGTNPLSSYGDGKMVFEACKQVEFLVVNDYYITPTALMADFVLPVAGAMERPVVHTNYGVTDSIVASQRAIWPMYERKTDYNIWRELGLACGQTEEDWPWPELEDAYMYMLSPLGLPIQSFDDFVENYRMYYPPLEFQKYVQKGEFCTASGKVEIENSVFEEFGLPGLPTYIGAPENEIDEPEVAEEFPIVLTTGGGFMPYHHSEHFNNPIIRYIKPEPYFSINPELAEKLGIEMDDWCWIETRRGRIKQRANVEPNVDPRVVATQRGWWFPERSPEGPQPFGCLESNTNVLTSVDDEHCDPLTGCWANRGLLCKVYKCTEQDNVYTLEDTQFSIPGSAFHELGGGVHEMPSKQQRALPFARKKYVRPDFMVPPGIAWDYKTRKAYDPQGRYYDPASGWMIDEETGTYYQRGTGYKYVSYNGDYLYDEKNDKWYDFENKRSNGPQPTFMVPPGLMWDKVELVAKHPKGYEYDPESGWLIDRATNVFYERNTLRAFDPIKNMLVDLETGRYYSVENPREEVSLDPTFVVPEGLVWDEDNQIAYHPGTGFVYDPESGWLVDQATNVLYEVYTQRAFDPEQNVLVDMETGKRYSLEDPTAEILDPEPPFDMPEGLEWDIESQLALDRSTGYAYDPDSGWMVDPESGALYQLGTNFKYVSYNGDFLFDEENDVWYDFEGNTNDGPQPDFDVPEGLEWDIKVQAALDPSTGYAYEPETGWMIDLETGALYQRETNYRYVSYNGDFLYDEENNKWYDFEGKRNNGPQPAFMVPPGLMWDKVELVVKHPKGYEYDPESGWLIDRATNVFYERNTLRAFDPVKNVLVDAETGKYYSVTSPREEVSLDPTFEVPEGLVWDEDNQIAYHPETGFVYDPESGWLVDQATNVLYEVYTLRAWDPEENVLVDMETGKRYSMEDPTAEILLPVAPFDVPVGVVWDVESQLAIDPDTGYVYDPDSGWMVDQESGTLYQLGTNFKYVSYNGDFLFDEANDVWYDFEGNTNDGPQPDFDIPEGLEWEARVQAAVDPGTGYAYEPETGWMIDLETGKYYQRETNYRYVSYNGDFLYDEENDEWYDFEGNTSRGPQAPFMVPPGLMWDKAELVVKHPSGYEYDPQSGWLIDRETNVFYERNTLRAYDPDRNVLVDAETGKYYSVTSPREEVSLDPTFEVPEGLVWDEVAQVAKHPDTGYVYDPESGWLIDQETNVYYEVTTLRAWDPEENVLVDMQTGKRYSMEDPTLEVDAPAQEAEELVLEAQV